MKKLMSLVVFCLGFSMLIAGCASNAAPPEDVASSDSEIIILDPPPGAESTATESEEDLDPLVIDLDDEDAPFISTGEPIATDGPDAWLLAGVTEGDSPIKANLKIQESRGAGVPTATVDSLAKDAVYTAIFNAPDRIFNADAVCAARIFHPSEVKSGEKGIIAAIVETIDGYAYVASTEFTAKDDLILKYAPSDSQPKVLFGAESLTVALYTSDEPPIEETFFEFSDEKSGELLIEFIDIGAIADDAE